MTVLIFQVRPQIFSAGTDARVLRELGIPTIGFPQKPLLHVAPGSSISHLVTDSGKYVKQAHSFALGLSEIGLEDLDFKIKTLPLGFGKEI